MRVSIRHETRYRYASAVRSLAQTLRLTPRSFEGQYVAAWRVDLSLDVPAPVREDVFGNLAQTLFVQGPLSEFAVEVTGVVETIDTHGVVAGAPEPVPPEVFLRTTPLTAPSPALCAFVRDAVQKESEPLARLHRLMSALNEAIRFDADATHAATSAAEAFETGAGVCQDHAHIFIAGARHLALPARYVSGHLARAEAEAPQSASHAWAEALVPGLGWVGFDPANGVCPTERHVRVAAGLDYASAGPMRGVRIGGGREAMEVLVEARGLGQTRAQTSG